MPPGLVMPPDPAALPACGAGSGATIADPLALIVPTCWHRSDHSSACDASTHPSSADWPAPFHARNRRSLPAPMVSVSLPRKPLELHSMPGRIRQDPPASYATVPPPAFPPPDPECSSCSIGPPDPHPPSDDRDWGEAHLAYAFLRRSLLRAFSDPAFPSGFPPVLPALPSSPAGFGLAAST